MTIQFLKTLFHCRHHLLAIALGQVSLGRHLRQCSLWIGRTRCRKSLPNQHCRWRLWPLGIEKWVSRIFLGRHTRQIGVHRQGARQRWIVDGSFGCSATGNFLVSTSFAFKRNCEIESLICPVLLQRNRTNLFCFFFFICFSLLDHLADLTMMKQQKVNLRSVGRKRFAHLSESQDEIHVDANIPWGEDTLFTLEFRADEGGRYALHTCNNR